jgi:hypothetical protein
MGSHDSELKQMRAFLTEFAALHKQARIDAADSGKVVKSLIDKVTKYDQKLNADGQLIVARIQHIESVEKSIEMFQTMLADVEKMDERADFRKYEGSKVIGKLDPKKPPKPQVVERIKDHLESESKRGKSILADQVAQMDKLKKHLAKFNDAIADVKRVDASLA